MLISKNNKIKTILISSLLLSMNANAIKEKSVLPISLGVGATSGGLIGVAAYFASQHFKKDNPAAIGITGFASFGLISYLTRKILKNYTPSAKYEKALISFRKEEINPIYKLPLTTPIEIKKYSDELYYAYECNINTFMKPYNDGLSYAKSNIDQAISNLYCINVVMDDVIKESDSLELTKQAKFLKQQVTSLLAISHEIKYNVLYAINFYKLDKLKAHDLLKTSINNAHDIKKETIIIYPKSNWPLLEADKTINSLIDSVKEMISDLNLIINNGKSSNLKEKTQSLKELTSCFLNYIQERKILIHQDKEEFDRQYNRYQAHLEKLRKEEEMRQKQLQHEMEMRLKEKQHRHELWLAEEKLSQERKLKEKQLKLQEQQLINQNLILHQAAHNNRPTNTTIVVNPTPQVNAPAYPNTFVNPTYVVPSAPPLETNYVQPTAPSAEEDLIECSICLDDHTNYKTVCGHYFHKNCINSWKDKCIKEKRTPVCPYCNGNI